MCPTQRFRTDSVDQYTGAITEWHARVSRGFIFFKPPVGEPAENAQVPAKMGSHHRTSRDGPSFTAGALK